MDGVDFEKEGTQRSERIQTERQTRCCPPKSVAIFGEYVVPVGTQIGPFPRFDVAIAAREIGAGIVTASGLLVVGGGH